MKRARWIPLVACLLAGCNLSEEDEHSAFDGIEDPNLSALDVFRYVGRDIYTATPAPWNVCCTQSDKLLAVCTILVRGDVGRVRALARASSALCNERWLHQRG